MFKTGEQLQMCMGTAKQPPTIIVLSNLRLYRKNAIFVISEKNKSAHLSLNRDYNGILVVTYTFTAKSLKI